MQATTRTVNFIHVLLDERDLFASARHFDVVNAMDHDEYAQYLRGLKAQAARLDQSTASRWIDSLKALPKKNGAAPSTTRERNDEVRVTEPGVYKVGDEIFVVKPNRDKSRLYAKKLVEAPSARLAEDGSHVHVEFEYAPGAIFRINPEDKMDLEEAKSLMIRYGKCIACNRRLKKAESVERGIGPVCIKYFRQPEVHGTSTAAQDTRFSPVGDPAEAVELVQDELAGLQGTDAKTRAEQFVRDMEAMHANGRTGLDYRKAVETRLRRSPNVTGSRLDQS